MDSSSGGLLRRLGRGCLRIRLDSKAALTILVLLHSAVTCLSLIKVATFQSYIHFSGERVWLAVAVAR